jgi:hypothetical protein
MAFLYNLEVIPYKHKLLKIPCQPLLLIISHSRLIEVDHFGPATRYFTHLGPMNVLGMRDGQFVTNY